MFAALGVRDNGHQDACMDDPGLNLRRPHRRISLPGNPPLRRLSRALQKSPLVRLIVVISIIVSARSLYVRIENQRVAWGTTVRAAQLSRSMRSGDVVRPADVRWVQLPRVAVGVTALTQERDIIGKRLAHSAGIGEIVSRSDIANSSASRLRASTGVGRLAVVVSLREGTPVARVGDEVDVLNTSGVVVAHAARVVQTAERQVTVSVTQQELAAVTVALNGPVVIAVRGEDA
jgi:hypothetical protein